MKLTVIYVPGLGDNNPKAQRFLVSSWRLWGVKPVFNQMNWADGQPFAPKLRQLLGKIDKLHTKGYKVCLVGASAGAGAVINAFAARKDKVSAVVVICGKINRPEAIGPGYRTKNPAFVESAYQVQSSLDKLDFKRDRQRIQSRYALFDPVVPVQDSRVVGGNNKSVPSVGHFLTITQQLSLGAPFWLNFLKQDAH